MKKILLILGGVLVLALGAGAGYYFFFPTNDYGDPRPPKDLTGIIVPPVEFPLKGRTFSVPDIGSSTTVVLDLVSPTAKRDYPMGRFTSVDGVVNGTLVALDDFTTELENNLRVVPIAVNLGGSGDFYYLAILEGEDVKHVFSFPLGDRIKVQTISRDGDVVTVNYLVHDRNQAMYEVPSVSTSAIFNLNTKQIVQAGRTPATEEVIETKILTGKYDWVSTKYEDGKVVTPVVPGAFTMNFDANRVSLETDCNTAGAVYNPAIGSSTAFSVEALATTKKFCESSQESEYFAMFQSITDYTQSSNGGISFTLKDKAVMNFSPKNKALEFSSTTAASE